MESNKNLKILSELVNSLRKNSFKESSHVICGNVNDDSKINCTLSFEEFKGLKVSIDLKIEKQ